MTTYEYKVVPAPKKGQRAKGVKTGEAKFANALNTLMNAFGADGWEYVRADTLPCEERAGLTSKTTSYYNVLVFRRALATAEAAAPLAIAHHPVTAQAVPDMRRPEPGWQGFTLDDDDMIEDAEETGVIHLLEARRTRDSDSPAAVIRAAE